jgi:hypothetical protein
VHLDIRQGTWAGFIAPEFRMVDIQEKHEKSSQQDEPKNPESAPCCVGHMI